MKIQKNILLLVFPILLCFIFFGLPISTDFLCAIAMLGLSFFLMCLPTSLHGYIRGKLPPFIETTLLLALLLIPIGYFFFRNWYFAIGSFFVVIVVGAILTIRDRFRKVEPSRSS